MFFILTYPLLYTFFSFHEQGVYDITSQLDLVKRITNRNDIILMSFSMGGTSAIAYSSLRPVHAKNSLKAMIHFGPIIHLSGLRGMAVHVSNWTMKSKFWVGQLKINSNKLK